MRVLILVGMLFWTGSCFGKGSLYSCEFKERQSDQSALACAMFWEASSVTEGYVGRQAVGLVIINRAYSKRFPNNVVDVVYQKAQFSFLSDGESDRVPNTYLDSIVWEECLHIAKGLLEVSHKDYKFFDYTKGSLWYHNTKVMPNWASREYLVVKINGHLFYDDDIKK